MALLEFLLGLTKASRNLRQTRSEKKHDNDADNDEFCSTKVHGVNLALGVSDEISNMDARMRHQHQ